MYFAIAPSTASSSSSNGNRRRSGSSTRSSRDRLRRRRSCRSIMFRVAGHQGRKIEILHFDVCKGLAV